MTEPLPPPRRRRSRSRVLLVAAAVLIAILAAQVVTSIGGALIAQQQASRAAEESFIYVGDLTVERVARYADSANHMVGSTANSIVRFEGALSLDQVAELLYQNLVLAPGVRSGYVGFPDGSFVSVSVEGTGYTSERVEVEPNRLTTLATYDARFTKISEEQTSSSYDPRLRPWYIAGDATSGTVWTDPYLQFTSGITSASAARAARNDAELVAVIGADLNLDTLGEVLDDLPLRGDAEAFVLSPERQVIAAPTSYAGQVAEIVAVTGEVPDASAIGIGDEAAAISYADGNVFGSSDGRISLERGFPPAEGLDWILHIEANERELSPGIGNLQVTIFVMTALSALLAGAVAFLMYRMWRPLRRLSLRARTDELTGLSNRHEYRVRGATLLRRAEMRGETVAVIAFDMDNFKSLNDELGHEAGDTALTLAGDALLAASRETDVVARMGGDEFVLMQTVSSVSTVDGVIERIRAQVEHTVQTQAPGGERIGVTAGYSLSRSEIFDLDMLMAEADAALMAGKRDGKGTTYRYRRQSAVPDDGDGTVEADPHRE